jgi:copper chaperone CopZ
MNTKHLSLAVCAALALSACGGKKQVKTAAETTNPIAVGGPAWVNQGSGAFKDGSFYGVGIATGIKNRALAIDTADARARAKVAEVFNTYISKLSKDYMASTTAGDMTSSSEEQNVTTALKSVTQMHLSGAMPVDHWKDPSDGSMFSLVKLDLAAVKSTMQQAQELDAKVRDYVRANADKAFEELAKEEAKR